MPESSTSALSERKAGMGRGIAIETVGSASYKADLRLLDAQMATVSPPAILDRERAIVVNIGSIKW